MIRVSEETEAPGEFTSSLWRCDHCDTFVSIHSTRTISRAVCPTCTTGSLNYCGNFDQILGAGSTDA